MPFDVSLTHLVACYKLEIWGPCRLRRQRLKKEIIITAVVFLAVGFLAGYAYNSYRRADQAQTATSDAPLPAQAEGASAGSGLPPGHPPIDSVTLPPVLVNEAEQNPKDPAPRLKIANFLYDQKQFDRSVEWYEKALALDPGNVDARTDLGTAFFYLGRPTDALREYNKSLAVNPRHEPTLFNIIEVNLDGTHDLARAKEAVQRLEKLNPDYPGLETMRQRVNAAAAAARSAMSSQ